MGGYLSVEMVILTASGIPGKNIVRVNSSFINSFSLRKACSSRDMLTALIAVSYLMKRGFVNNSSCRNLRDK